MYLIQILYIISGLIALGAGIPQMLRLIAAKNSDEFSTGTWVMWMCTQAVAAVYMMTIGDLLAIIVSWLWVTFYAVMVALIFYYTPKKTVLAEVSVSINSLEPRSNNTK